MKRFYLTKLPILILLLTGLDLSVQAQLSTYNYTGGVQTYTVPSGVTSVFVDMQGATGGNAYNGYGNGGGGGRVVCNLAVTPGQVLNIFCGWTRRKLYKLLLCRHRGI